MFKKILCLVLILMMASCGVVFADTTPGDGADSYEITVEDDSAAAGETPSLISAPAGPLSDIVGQTYEAAVRTLVDKGVITGDVDGLYHGDQNLTRAQAAKIIVAEIDPSGADLTGTPTQSGPAKQFPDLSGYGWAAGYINYMAGAGIAAGYPDGTFGPGRNVTVAEMLTFIVRAAGYTDQSLSGAWPNNYIAKATELGYTAGLGDITNVSVPATKGQMAQAAYNAMADIEKYNSGQQGQEEQLPPGVPDIRNMTYVSAGSFDNDVTTYAGKPFASDVKVYVYGMKSGFSQSMELPQKADAYAESSIYNYKGSSTPAWIKTVDGKITEMILPKNTAFDGRVYCVINDVGVSENSEGKRVTSFNTITAGREVDWLFKNYTDFTDLVSSTELLEGHVYELIVDYGTASQINCPDPGLSGVGTPRNSAFTTLGGTGMGWQTVTDYSNNLVYLANGEMVTVADNAAVFVYSEDSKKYRSGSVASIRKGKSVRLFSLLKDDQSTAMLVTVK